MTTKADTSVRWFHESMPGAPVLASGDYGAFLALLKACLIDGFGYQAVDGVVVSGGVATVSISSGNGFVADSVIRLSGAAQGLLNDDWRIATATATSFTFACPGVPDTTEGASVTIGVAPAKDWQMPFYDSVNKIGVFRSAALGATGFFFRLNDSALYRYIDCYESMSDIDTGVDKFSSNSTCIAFGSATATELTWFLAADDRCFHFVGDFSSHLGRGIPLTFGDMVPIINSDAYFCVIAGPGSTASTPSNYMGLNRTGAIAAKLARSFSGLLKSYGAVVGQLSVSTSALTTSSYDTADIALYSGAMPLFGSPAIIDTDAKVVRGFAAGLKTPGIFKDMGGTQNRELITSQSGEKYMAVNCNTNSNAYKGIIVFDILGPWR